MKLTLKQMQSSGDYTPRFHVLGETDEIAVIAWTKGPHFTIATISEVWAWQIYMSPRIWSTVNGDGMWIGFRTNLADALRDIEFLLQRKEP